MSKMKSKKPASVKQVVEKVADNQAKAAQQEILRETFYDLCPNRWGIYRVNFFRGIFFGFGSVLGATLIVAIVVWVLGQFGNIFPPLADFINNLIDTMQKRQ